MGPLEKLASVRRRFNELAAGVGEGRELSRGALSGTQALQAGLTALSERQASLDAKFDAIREQLASLATAEQARSERERLRHADLITSIRHVHANEAWHRRRLRELRTTPEYESAYTDPDPLISVLISTYERLDLVRSRVIPSILAQDHRNLEIVIVGDCAPYDAADVTEGFAGAPIRYRNLPLRGPYPEDPTRRWLVAGTPPFNEAMALSRGAWLAPFADDDAMRPQHLSALLAAARERRLEFVYGRLQQHLPDGPDRVLGAFPPALGATGLQAALLHGELKLFEFELADADFEVPNDWAQIERMLRAGVRTGMIDDVVADYYPSLRAMRDDG